MAEHDMRQRVVRALAGLHAFPVENPVHPGTPDIALNGAWIECKWMREWPARPDTIVKLDHELNTAQRLWHKTHHRLGGRSYVLLQVRHEWLLFGGLDAALHLERDWTREHCSLAALRHWRAGLVELELRTWVT